MRPTSSGKRPLEPGGDDMVCGLEVCDEFDEGNAQVNDCEGDYTDEITGATLLRDDVAKARAEDDGVVRQVRSLRRGDGRDMPVKNRTQTPSHVDGKTINKGDSERVEVRSRLIVREIKTERELTATSHEHLR